MKNDIVKGEAVTVLMSKTPPILEAHFSALMTKGIRHSLNTKLDAAIIVF